MTSASHLHLLLNHLPAVGSLFTLALLAWCLWRKSEAVQRVSLAVAFIVALATISHLLYW